MLDKKEKLKILKIVVESQTFREAHRLRDLLSYLVNESVEGRKPKEASIAIDVLGKDKDFDSKGDAIVRVYINNLRNKLEQFYLSDQADTIDYRIRIPKGRYEVEFEPLIHQKPVAKDNRIYFLFGGIVTILCAVIIYLLVINNGKNTNAPVENNQLLQEVLNSNNKPTLIVLGDFFFMNQDKENSSEHFNIRDFSINSMDDFIKASKANPEFQRKFSPSPYTYLRPSSSWGLLKLMQALPPGLRNVSVKLASQFTADDFKSSNVIFLGQVKSMFVLQKFLSVYGLRCNIDSNSIRVSGTAPGDERLFTPANMLGGKYEKDYAMMVRGNGPEGTNFLLLMGFAEIGVLEAVNAAVDPKAVEKIRQNLEKAGSKDLNNFTAVLEAEGLNQTIFDAQVTFVSHRQPNFNLWERSK